MKRFISRKNLNGAVGLILIIALIIGIVALLVSVFGGNTKQISSTSFAVGGLDINGEFRKSDKSLYSKEPFCCQGLKIEKAFESKSRYEVYYYREDNSFIGSTDIITDHSYEKGASFPNAMYARIVITPVLDADAKLNFLNQYTYANEFKITVSNDQTFAAPTISIFPNIKTDFATYVSSGGTYKHSVMSQSPYVYQNTNDFSGKTVKKISVPISGVQNHREDSYFTVYVVEPTGTSGFTKVSEHKLYIPSGSYSTSLDLEALKTNNTIADVSKTVLWFDFDLNVTLKDNQTLAFGSDADTAYMAYRTEINHDAYKVYNNAFESNCEKVNVYIYVDVNVLE